MLFRLLARWFVENGSIITLDWEPFHAFYELKCSRTKDRPTRTRRLPNDFFL
jgi:hypothetical protein